MRFEDPQRDALELACCVIAEAGEGSFGVEHPRDIARRGRHRAEAREPEGTRGVCLDDASENRARRVDLAGGEKIPSGEWIRRFERWRDLRQRRSARPRVRPRGAGFEVREASRVGCWFEVRGGTRCMAENLARCANQRALARAEGRTERIPCVLKGARRSRASRGDGGLASGQRFQLRGEPWLTLHERLSGADASGWVLVRVAPRREHLRANERGGGWSVVSVSVSGRGAQTSPERARRRQRMVGGGAAAGPFDRANAIVG